MTGNYVDVKHTIWQRYHYKDDAEMNKIVDAIKNNKDFIDDELGFTQSEDIAETLDQMSVSQNNGQPTIEIYAKENSCDPLWDNVNEFDL